LIKHFTGKTTVLA